MIMMRLIESDAIETEDEKREFNVVTEEKKARKR